MNKETLTTILPFNLRQTTRDCVYLVRRDHFLTCDWNSELNADGSSIDDMWKTFKHKVLEGIEAFIPGRNKYSTWKKKFMEMPTIKRGEITNQEETSHVD